MYKKLTWGLGVLALLISTAFVFMTVRYRADIRQLKEEAAEAEKLSEDRNKHLAQQPDVGNKPPQEAKDGFKWEWHGDHWHEMPLSESVEVSNKTQLQHEPVRTPPEQTEDVVMWDGRPWSEYSPKEKEAAKQQNRLMIWVTYDLIKKTKATRANSPAPDRFLVLPIWEEQYQVLTENPFPYTPDVLAQLNDIGWRVHDAMVEQARLWEEDSIKHEAYWNEKLKRSAQNGELDD